MTLVSGFNAYPNEVVAFCKRELTPCKVPKHVYFRTELPKTNVGKMLRRRLRDELSQGSPAR